MANLARTTAVILAGGLGTRLRTVVSDRPKVLAEVAGRPFLGYLLDRLAAVGVQRVVLCTGYLAELVNSTFGENYRGVELVYSREEQPLGTGGALRLALPLIDSDPVLVLNGDSFCNANLKVFCDRHIRAGAKASLVLTRVPDVGRYGVVDTDAVGAVTSFVEKGERQGEGLINAGIYLLSRTMLATIPATGAVSLEREIFPQWIGKGLYAFSQPARFIDIGIPADLQVAATVLHTPEIAEEPGASS